MVLITTIILIFTYSANAVAQDTNLQTLDLANKNYLEGNLKSAKENIRTLLKSHPENKNLLYNLGIIEYKQNNLNKAIGYLVYSHIKGNKRALSFLQSIQDKANFSIHKISLLDRVLNIPLNAFLSFFILVLIIARAINSNTKVWRFKSGLLKVALIIVFICIIFIKIRKDAEVWAVSIYDTPLYAASSEQSAIIMSLPIGTKVVIKQTPNPPHSDLWHLVSANNKQGFVLKNHLFYPKHSLIKR